MGSTTTVEPVVGTDASLLHEDMFQVVLHNDDWNTIDHVVRCLVRIFGHSTQLAVKIMMEAHRTGRAVAEVEAETEAKRHRDQLQSAGLSATVERI
ncbi:MAG: ATP-dependent Clp protease adaptor ClpS [Lentisphaerae bacterium]|nr:ATP-dependent Clp protease adaptor ClpS [Lentisphaerota bacterium]